MQFESFQKADEWGKVQYGKYGEEYKKIVDRRKNYTNNQKQKIPIHNSISWYCGYGYRQINSMLRGKPYEDYGYNDIMVEDIISTMYKVPA